MNIKKLISLLALGLAFVCAQAWADTPKTLDLFGTTLKNATRDQLRSVYKSNGLQSTREDKNYWVDTYNAKGVLEGATEFNCGYVSATDKFAYAVYTFPTFMDERLVERVVNLVSTKYGRPSSMSGNYGLGPVVAKWSLPQGMQIEVSRGWPDTTTYLKFIDVAANKAMETEMNESKKAQEAAKARAQSKAF